MTMDRCVFEFQIVSEFTESNDTPVIVKLPAAGETLQKAKRAARIDDWNGLMANFKWHIDGLEELLPISGDVELLNAITYEIADLSDQGQLPKLLAVLEDEQPQDLCEAYETIKNLAYYDLTPDNQLEGMQMY